MHHGTRAIFVVSRLLVIASESFAIFLAHFTTVAVSRSDLHLIIWFLSVLRRKHLMRHWLCFHMMKQHGPDTHRNLQQINKFNITSDFLFTILVEVWLYALLVIYKCLLIWQLRARSKILKGTFKFTINQGWTIILHNRSNEKKIICWGQAKSLNYILWRINFISQLKAVNRLLCGCVDVR